jgi:8-oxo-dGTP pyrophosphatase MutT (NUDIX family)
MGDINRSVIKDAIRGIPWVEGQHTALVFGPYRYRITITASQIGRQRAVFADGAEHPYFAYVEIDGTGRGGGIVPVLPDGRFIMVIEQRPCQYRFAARPTHIELEDGRRTLDEFGPYSSLEFPGGSIEVDEDEIKGPLRELQEETGVNDQAVTLYRRLRPCYPFGSDVVLQNFYQVVFLSSGILARHVRTDGGLHVLTLSRREVERNIRNGVIVSGQAALLPWSFYTEVEEARKDSLLMQTLTSDGYLVEEYRTLRAV